MVEVAKALSMDSRILIMDEPTSALTDREIEELFVIIRRLKAKGVPIIYISHRLDELYANLCCVAFFPTEKDAVEFVKSARAAWS